MNEVFVAHFKASKGTFEWIQNKTLGVLFREILIPFQMRFQTILKAFCLYNEKELNKVKTTFPF